MRESKKSVRKSLGWLVFIYLVFAAIAFASMAFAEEPEQEQVKVLPNGDVVLSKERAAELEGVLGKALEANAELSRVNRALAKELERRAKDRCI